MTEASTTSTLTPQDSLDRHDGGGLGLGCHDPHGSELINIQNAVNNLPIFGRL